MFNLSIRKLLLVIVVSILALTAAACDYFGSANSQIWPAGTVSGISGPKSPDPPLVYTPYGPV